MSPFHAPRELDNKLFANSIAECRSDFIWAYTDAMLRAWDNSISGTHFHPKHLVFELAYGAKPDEIVGLVLPADKVFDKNADIPSLTQAALLYDAGVTLVRDAANEPILTNNDFGNWQR
jgi:hypothetical protein